MLQVSVQITLEPGAQLPTYQTSGSAGMDLRCLEDFELEPMQRKLVRTGIRIALPEGFEAQVRPRSGLALKHGIAMVNSPGTIDWDYRGEIGLILINLGSDVVRFSCGERIGQLVICPVARAEMEIVDGLDQTARGSGGFGSTGS